jgi:hypothetical protein
MPRGPYAPEPEHILIICDWCRRRFFASRATRFYCSNRCRQAAYRDRLTNRPRPNPLLR